MTEAKKNWGIRFGTEFELEFPGLPDSVRNKISEGMRKLEIHGPRLGRPDADGLRGSKHNGKMKEMRFYADDGAWRVFFAFDPDRNGIILLAADKAGISGRRFYDKNIRKADERFERHLKALEQKKTQDHQSARKPRNAPARKMKGDRGNTRHRKGRKNRR